MKVLELQIRDFFRQPSAGSFLAGNARETGDWERIRPQLPGCLEGNRNWSELLTIVLAEGDANLAVGGNTAMIWPDRLKRIFPAKP